MKVTPNLLEAAFKIWVQEWQLVPASHAAAQTMDVRTVNPAVFAAEVTPYFIELLKRAGAEE